MFTRHKALWLILAAAFVLFVPWLGGTDFYTKGEPREAIVAVSMLQTDNWILPVSYGADIPYKPPLLAWCIAALSLIFNGGHVSEFLARLPSAIAACVLATMTWRTVRRHAGEDRAWVTTLVLITSFEVFRAATACRVDMLLTVFMCGAIFGLVRMGNSVRRWLVTILLLSGGFLVKGPVGALLPCLVAFVYFLVTRQKPVVNTLRITAAAIASFVIPALWYYAAWKQGGQTFLDLAWEENIGRLTGTMSYDSHINPWYYNVTAMLAGLLPWTVPAVAAMCTRKFRHDLRRVRPAPGVPQYFAVAFAVIFIFYCIPASKRSVYLLPVYPMAAYAVAWIFDRTSTTAVARVWSVILSIINILAPLLFAVAALGFIPKIHPATVHWWQWCIAAVPALYSIFWLLTRKSRSRRLSDCLLLTYLALVAYNATYMPMALNIKSDRPAAEEIARTVAPDERIWSVIPEDSLLRYYSIDYYLHDRLRHARTLDEIPSGDWVLANPDVLPGAKLLTPRSADTRRPAAIRRKP